MVRDASPYILCAFVTPSDWQSIFLKINRTRPGDLLRAAWNWDHGYPSGAPILMFGFNDKPNYQPSLGDSERYYEDYCAACRTPTQRSPMGGDGICLG